MNEIWGRPARPLQYAKAIANSDLPSGVRATCWALATFADNETGLAWPSVKKLSEAAGLSRAVVSKHTTLAEAKGYLRKDRRYNGSIFYTITIPVGAENRDDIRALEQLMQEAPQTRGLQS
ncbi:helix-turn-helix domain-containing protein [Arthrobacter cupressi]|uniref:Helix-turn-helix domain-containing protein n=1 Tax=Arthrobacter cupressi TaxID=1045773 RepID=A0A1G8SPT5_9MICC|nr:helix-turn-helix domain-containing protein [Arthrobacter cupressi]NYD78437.1 DNA-binding transcriptional ArsR family regulator [Arthrobacter cupressi]SDJ31221.1 Helix-turn-helix domain-containing protein [Arthrobacter cupressi]